jgi:hypothetical protein
MCDDYKKIWSRMIGDEMFFVAKVVATEIFLSSIVWQQKKFNYHTISDKKISIVASLVIENFPS